MELHLLPLWARHHELCPDSQRAAGQFQWDADGKQEEFEVNTLHPWGPASQTEARAQLCGVRAVGALRDGNRGWTVYGWPQMRNWGTQRRPLLKQFLYYLALCPSPTLARCSFPVFGIILSRLPNYSLRAPAQRRRRKPGSGERWAAELRLLDRSFCGRVGAPLNTLSPYSGVSFCSPAHPSLAFDSPEGRPQPKSAQEPPASLERSSPSALQTDYEPLSPAPRARCTVNVSTANAQRMDEGNALGQVPLPSEPRCLHLSDGITSARQGG